MCIVNVFYSVVYYISVQHALHSTNPLTVIRVLTSGLSLRRQPVALQHLRRAVLQRVRLQLAPAQQEPPMTARGGRAPHTLTSATPAASPATL